MRKILFITPYFQRSGSELVLYNIISNLHEPEYKICLVVTKGKGELLYLLPENIRTFVYRDYYNDKLELIEKLNKNFFYRIYRLIFKLIFPQKKFPEEIKASYDDFFSGLTGQFKADIWYINTILVPEALNYARKLKIPCIVHSHEMENIFNLITENDLENLLNTPKLIIACSEASARPLRISGRKDNIKICYPFLDFKNINSNRTGSVDIRKKYNISPSAFIWTMAGMPDINKDPVIFVDICRELCHAGHNVHFMWLGAGSESAYLSFAKNKAKYYELDNKITWTGMLNDDYYSHLSGSDGFLLTSHMDSFPLVMIESAYFGKPIAGFNSGGISEFIDIKNKDNECIGKITKTNNFEELLEIMIDIMSGKINFKPELSVKRALEFNIPMQLPKWQEIINNYF